MKIVAAIAVQNELTLISRDEHFEYIDTLDLVTW